jgi:GntR family transcriptional regulator
MASPVFSSVPLHHQIAQVLRVRIESGRWASGDPMTEQALCEEFRVSRTTVRQALAQLKQLGLLQARRGVGTRGVPPAKKIVRSSGNPLHAGLPTRMRVDSLGLAPAPGPVAAFFGIPQGGAVFRFVRVHELDGSPFSVIDCYLPARFSPAFTKAALRKMSAHELLWRRFKLRQARSVHAIRVARADTEVAGLLGIALADPVLRVQTSV